MKKLLLFSLFLLGLNTTQAQDLIIKLNGDEISAKILEISEIDVKYKKFNYQDGPTYTIKKSDIFMIKYPNGDKEVFGVQKSNNTTTNGTKADTTTLVEEPVIPSVPVDTNYVYGIKIEESPNTDYDRIYCKNGTVIEGKLIDITEENVVYTGKKDKKGIIQLKIKNNEVEMIDLLSSNNTIHKKIKKIHVSAGTKSNKLGGAGHKDDRLIGATITGYDKENDTLRKEWKANGGALNAMSYDAGLSMMWYSDYISGTSIYMSGAGFSINYATNKYKLKLPVYTEDLKKAPWGTWIYGTGMGFNYNSTYTSISYQESYYDPITNSVRTRYASDDIYSSYSMFTIPINIGYCWARGKFLTPNEWRGNMFGLIYKPGVVMTMTDAGTDFKFNPIGFGFEFSRGGLQNSLDKIAPKPHWRIGAFVLPPIGSLPFSISINAGITILKSLKK